MVRMIEHEARRVANNKSQVLNKRKPVHLIPNSTDIPDNAEVYVMRGTNEIFTDYEKFLKRYDWLAQKKFTDGVNGKSGLTYWDALDSETKSSASIDVVFPEVLRDPILRRVQFSTISRMDELVNSVYADFKHDFFPGETVTVTIEEGETYQGQIREKAQFPMIRGADGSVQRAPFSRYFVRLEGRQGEEALLDDKHLRRDKKVFTKQNVRAFLKNSLQRESWTGAPWLVKEHLAIQYRLPMEIPAHLLQDARLLQSKQQMLQMRPPKGRKPKNVSPEDLARMQQEDQMRMQRPHQQQNPGVQPNHTQHYHQQTLATRMEPPRPPPPTIKYPIEDLDIAPKRNGVTRPELKFFTEEMSEYIRGGRTTTFDDIDMQSMGPLLEVWNTLNVQCEVYVMDSFTFDDFVDAMRYDNVDVPCELFEEIHCAVIKMFVDDKGKIQVKDLPKIEEISLDDSEVQDESEASTPLPDVPARSTRSRLSQVENAADSPTPEKTNRAQELLAENGWYDRLMARDFHTGGWQVIVVGILHQLAASPIYKTRCEQILAHLVPADAEPTRETARVQYANMDINLRISALQMLVLLTVRTDAIKDFLEACSDDMTDVRKRKIEHQRERRAAMEELAMRDRERKILLPENMPQSPKVEILEPDVTMDDSLDVNGEGSSDQDDDIPTNGRSLRRGQDRKRKREEETARREKEAREKAEAAKAQNKQSKEFKKILNEIEHLRQQIKDHEDKIADCDADLREANVQRTKVLGKDRFCNRYYWFERNGQPFGGLPRSSTSNYGYANGRIWVQGPDDMERDGFIDLPAEEQAEYKQRFHMTVPERRRQEEGVTSLSNAHEWGFYDGPERLDNLIGWLDERGDREKKLRKELCEWRDRIVQYMVAYKQFQENEAAKQKEMDDEMSTRVTTRHKIQEEQTAAQQRCLKWTNSMAMDELGHIHSKPRRAKEKKAAPQKREVKGVAITVNRNGKPGTRQGDKHSSK